MLVDAGRCWLMLVDAMLYYTFATETVLLLLLPSSSATSTHKPGLSLPSGLLGIASFVLNTPFLLFLSGVPNSL
jgi:hypothetical protein